MAKYLLWWGDTLVLITGLIGSPRLTQEMNMFSASPARITSGRHVPEQTEPFEKNPSFGGATAYKWWSQHLVLNFWTDTGLPPAGSSAGSFLNLEILVTCKVTRFFQRETSVGPLRPLSDQSQSVVLPDHRASWPQPAFYVPQPWMLHHTSWTGPSDGVIAIPPNLEQERSVPPEFPIEVFHSLDSDRAA